MCEVYYQAILKWHRKTPWKSLWLGRRNTRIWWNLQKTFWFFFFFSCWRIEELVISIWDYENPHGVAGEVENKNLVCAENNFIYWFSLTWNICHSWMRVCRKHNKAIFKRNIREGWNTKTSHSHTVLGQQLSFIH